MLIIVELFLTLALTAVAFLSPGIGAGWFGALERGFSALARRRRLTILVVAGLPMALRIVLLPILPVPIPGVHDEFSYLLAADTFAHGRLTNPPHPMWIHFESIHILQQPTYASMYFPAQGLILAAGQVIAGLPWLGVLASVGIMCGAICWALQGWMPARWALLGGLLAGMRFGVFNYWMNSYWGGAAAAIGGALVLGALPRIKRWRRIRDAILMGLGLAILANSRPYEGMVYSLPIGVALVVWMFRKDSPSWRVAVPRIVLPVVFVLGVTFAGMGYYFWRVTGSPWRVPEAVNFETYHMGRLFYWQKPAAEPVYHHAVMRDYYRYWLQKFEEARSVKGAIGATLAKMIWIWLFYLGPAFTLPLIGAMAIVPYGYPWSRFSARLRFLLITAVVGALGLALNAFFFPHYAAPLTALIVALVVQAMRYLRLWQWHGRPTGRFLVRAVPLTCGIMLLICLGAKALGWGLLPYYPYTWYTTAPGNLERARVRSQLQQLDGRHLVIVRYGPEHNVNNEWVYNRADIDAAKIVWAREMGSPQDQELIHYFAGRRVWLVDADEGATTLRPYSPPNDQAVPELGHPGSRR
jgi:hypothetical protein